MTHFFFPATELMEMDCPITWGDDSEQEAEGSGLHT